MRAISSDSLRRGRDLTADILAQFAARQQARVAREDPANFGTNRQGLLQELRVRRRHRAGLAHQRSPGLRASSSKRAAHCVH